MTRSAYTVCALAFCALFAAACDESVDPILESDRNYTLFGTLDMEADTQFVRVERIREVLDPGEPTPLNVGFTSTDLNTGDVVVWRDSLITFIDGSAGHVFYAPMRLVAGHTYRIVVEDPTTSVLTSAETTVPTLSQAQVLPATFRGGAGGAVGTGTQSIVWQNLDRDPFFVEAWYRFMIAERTPFVDVVLPYEPRNGPTGSDDWEVTLDLRQDRLTLDTLFQVREYPLIGVGLRITVLDQKFVPPGGVFDPDVLVQPGTFSNVENGFGFIGSVARFSAEWLLPEDALEAMDYVTVTDRFGKEADAVRQGVVRQKVERSLH